MKKWMWRQAFPCSAASLSRFPFATLYVTFRSSHCSNLGLLENSSRNLLPCPISIPSLCTSNSLPLWQSQKWGAGPPCTCSHSLRGASQASIRSCPRNLSSLPHQLGRAWPLLRNLSATSRCWPSQLPSQTQSRSYLIRLLQPRS